MAEANVQTQGYCQVPNTASGTCQSSNPEKGTSIIGGTRQIVTIPGALEVSQNEVDGLTQHLKPIFTDAITLKLEVLECTDIPSMRDPGSKPSTYAALRWFDRSKSVAESHVVMQTTNPKFNWNLMTQLPRNETTLIELCGRPMTIYLKEAVGDKLERTTRDNSSHRTQSPVSQPGEEEQPDATEEPSLGTVTGLAQIDLLPFVTKGITSMEQWCPIILSPPAERAVVNASLTKAAAFASQVIASSKFMAQNSSSETAHSKPNANSSSGAVEEKPRRTASSMVGVSPSSARGNQRGNPPTSASSASVVSARGGVTAPSNSTTSANPTGGIVDSSTPVPLAFLTPDAVHIQQSQPRIRIRVSLSAPLVTEEERDTLTVLEVTVNKLEGLPSKWLDLEETDESSNADLNNRESSFRLSKYVEETKSLQKDALSLLNAAQQLAKISPTEISLKDTSSSTISSTKIEEAISILTRIPPSIRSRVGQSGDDELSAQGEPSSSTPTASTRSNTSSSHSKRASSAVPPSSASGPQGSSTVPASSSHSQGSTRGQSRGGRGSTSNQQQILMQQQAQQNQLRESQMMGNYEESVKKIEDQSVFSVSYAMPLTANHSLPVKHVASKLSLPPLSEIPPIPEGLLISTNPPDTTATSVINSNVQDQPESAGGPGLNFTSGSLSSSGAQTRRRASKVASATPSPEEVAQQHAQAVAAEAETKRSAWVVEQKQLALKDQAEKRFVKWNSTRRAFLTPLTVKALLEAANESSIEKGMEFYIWSSKISPDLVKTIKSSLQSIYQLQMQVTKLGSPALPSVNQSQNQTSNVGNLSSSTSITSNAPSLTEAPSGRLLISTDNQPSVSSTLSLATLSSVTPIPELVEALDGVPVAVANVKPFSRKATFPLPMPKQTPDISVTESTEPMSSANTAEQQGVPQLPVMPTVSIPQTSAPSFVPSFLNLRSKTEEVSVPYFSMPTPNVDDQLWPPTLATSIPIYAPSISHADVISDHTSGIRHLKNMLQHFPEQARLRCVAKFPLERYLKEALNESSSVSEIAMELPVELDRRCAAHVLLSLIADAEIEAVSKRVSEINDFSKKEKERLAAIAQASSSITPSDSRSSGTTPHGTLGGAPGKRRGGGLGSLTPASFGGDKSNHSSTHSAQQSGQLSTSTPIPLVPSRDSSDPGFILLDPLEQCSIVARIARETVLKNGLASVGICTDSAPVLEKIIASEVEGGYSLNTINKLIAYLSKEKKLDLFYSSKSKLSVQIKVTRPNKQQQHERVNLFEAERASNLKSQFRLSIKEKNFTNKSKPLTTLPFTIEEQLEKEVHMALTDLAELYDSPPREPQAAVIRSRHSYSNDSDSHSQVNSAISSIALQTVLHVWNAAGNVRVFVERVRPTLMSLYRQLYRDFCKEQLPWRSISPKDFESNVVPLEIVSKLFANLMRSLSHTISQIAKCPAKTAKDSILGLRSGQVTQLSNIDDAISYYETLSSFELKDRAKACERFDFDWDSACQYLWRLVAVPEDYQPSHSPNQEERAGQGLDFALHSAHASPQHWLELAKFYLRVTNDASVSDSDSRLTDDSFVNLHQAKANGVGDFPIVLLPVSRAQKDRKAGLEFAEFALKQVLSLVPHHADALALIVSVYLCQGNARMANTILEMHLDQTDSMKLLYDSTGLSQQTPKHILLVLRYMSFKACGRALEAKEALASALAAFAGANQALYNMPIPYTAALPTFQASCGSAPLVTIMSISLFTGLFVQVADYFTSSRLLPLSHVALSHAFAASGASILSIAPAPYMSSSPSFDSVDFYNHQRKQRAERVYGSDFLIQLGRFYVALSKSAAEENEAVLKLAERCFAAATLSLCLLQEVLDDSLAGGSVQWAKKYLLSTSNQIASPVPVSVRLKLTLPILAELGITLMQNTKYQEALHVLRSYRRWSSQYLAPHQVNDQAIFSLAILQTEQVLHEAGTNTDVHRKMLHETKDLMSSVAQAHPYVATCQLYVAKLCIALRNFSEAKISLEHAYVLSPQNHDLWFAASELYKSLGNSDEDEKGSLATPERICERDNLRIASNAKRDAASIRGLFLFKKKNGNM